MLQGPSGVGKTALARALAEEYGAGLIKVVGYCGHAELTRKLTELKQAEFLFVDECHRLGPAEQELLMETIENRNVPGLAKAAGAQRVAIPTWTLVLATDQPGKLLDALYKRIVITVELDLYTTTELKEIVEVAAARIGLQLSPQAARVIAEASHGLPRRAEHHLMKLRLHFPAADRPLGRAEVSEYLRSFELDESGLGRLGRRYLVTLREMGSASLESLARILGTDTDYVKKQVECVLLRRGLIGIDSSGRKLTTKGREWVARDDPSTAPGTGEAVTYAFPIGGAASSSTTA